MADSELKFVTLLTSHQGRLFAYVLSLVDELALFNQTLSPEQIKALYEAAPQQ